MSTSLWAVLALLPGGLFTGAVALLACERVWLWRRMPIDDFAVDFRRSLERVDPGIPILLIISATGAMGLASQSQGSMRVLLAVAIGSQLLIFAGSLAVAVPINAQFRRRPEGALPPRAEELRRRWRRLHLARSALALVAFICIVFAIA